MATPSFLKRIFSKKDAKKAKKNMSEIEISAPEGNEDLGKGAQK